MREPMFQTEQARSFVPNAGEQPRQKPRILDGRGFFWPTCPCCGGSPPECGEFESGFPAFEDTCDDTGLPPDELTCTISGLGASPGTYCGGAGIPENELCPNANGTWVLSYNVSQSSSLVCVWKNIGDLCNIHGVTVKIFGCSAGVTITARSTNTAISRAKNLSAKIPDCMSFSYTLNSGISSLNCGSIVTSHICFGGTTTVST